MDKVYVVTRGEYSDYRIDSVWSTREAAEAELSKASGYGKDGQVEEYSIDGPGKTWLVRYVAEFDLQGAIVVRDSPMTFEGPQDRQTYVVRSRVSDGGWSGAGYGATPEHARKSLSDALAKAKAEELESA